MTSRSVEDFLQRVREKYPVANPKLIHDNGSAFVSRDFQALVSRLGITSVHTRRNHPETNGTIERLNGTVRQEALRVTLPHPHRSATHCRLSATSSPSTTGFAYMLGSTSYDRRTCSSGAINRFSNRERSGSASPEPLGS